MDNIGTVIEGTLVTHDLIGAIIDWLECNVPAKVYQEVLETFQDDPNLERFLWECLFDQMDELSPEGYYFGAHPGDSSDFGFWELEEVRDD